MASLTVVTLVSFGEVVPFPLSLFLEIECIYVSLFDVRFAHNSDGIHSVTSKTILTFQEVVIFFET